MKRNTIIDIKNKKGASAIVCLTAYSAPIAKILDKHCDILLVGDSLGMVIYGMDSTLGVSISMMINHAKAVVKSSKKALIVVDMPFGSYQRSQEYAFANAAKIMAQTGCDAIKLEGGGEMQDTISFLVKRGIPVMAHIGLKPQSVNISGGYRSHGDKSCEREQILRDAIAVEQAGAFAVVIEKTVEDLAQEITAQLLIPTIGIGAGLCDGQVLVSEDMTGLFDGKTPPFVKEYGNIGQVINESAQQFAADVRAKKFP